ncbi:hypothetical protein [Actinophytocola sp.]|uniref:hypothetical protein n=1 Tax=Actinophytocola sp. TaxID=1872138 RepID=UPI002D80D1D8|nr:hypothetical protein [Actinophytocola sp.]HET9142431.1 hypothetical protein [Actinophytocola sp.]
MSEADGWGGVRTVCHGCRTMREVVEQVDTHQFEVRAMIVPGDGTVYRRIRASFEVPDVIVEIPCPDCANRLAADRVAADRTLAEREVAEAAGPDEDLDEEPDDEDDEDDPEWLLPGFVPPA